MGVDVFIKKKILARATRDCRFLEDLFPVCPETWVALDTAKLLTFFSELWQKCTKCVLVQPGPMAMVMVMITMAMAMAVAVAVAMVNSSQARAPILLRALGVRICGRNLRFLIRTTQA